jgi:hypothetical protein
MRAGEGPVQGMLTDRENSKTKERKERERREDKKA